MNAFSDHGTDNQVDLSNDQTVPSTPVFRLLLHTNSFDCAPLPISISADSIAIIASRHDDRELSLIASSMMGVLVIAGSIILPGEIRLRDIPEHFPCLNFSCPGRVKISGAIESHCPISFVQHLPLITTVFTPEPTVHNVVPSKSTRSSQHHAAGGRYVKQSQRAQRLSSFSSFSKHWLYPISAPSTRH